MASLQPLRRSCLSWAANTTASTTATTFSATSTTASRTALCLASPRRQQSSARPFSTSRPALVKTIQPSRLPTHIIPPYPYGERRLYKQSNKGLYGSARIRFGNNVSEKHNVKTQRLWRPNVHVKIFEIPGIISTPEPVAPTAHAAGSTGRKGAVRIRTRLTLRVLKTIRREGGLVNYLLKSKPARLRELGPGGWNLRWLVMQTRAVQERFNAERVALGLEPRDVEDRDDIIRYALDYATPGPLSQTNRLTEAGLLIDMGLHNSAGISPAFDIGNEDFGEFDDAAEALSDEAEAKLLAEMEVADLDAAQSPEGTGKKTVEV